MASLTSGEMTHAHWLRSIFAGPLLSRIGPAVHCLFCTDKYRTARSFRTDLALRVRSVPKTPLSDISLYRPHARLMRSYYSREFSTNVLIV